MSQRIKPYTLPSRSKSPTHEPKLVNKYVFANTLTDRIEEESTYPQQRLIRNAGFSSKIEVMNIK